MDKGEVYFKLGTFVNYLSKFLPVFYLLSTLVYNYSKVYIFWEGHKILRNLHQLFVLCTASQIVGGDFAKFCGLLRIYELYYLKLFWASKSAVYNQQQVIMAISIYLPTYLVWSFLALGVRNFQAFSNLPPTLEYDVTWEFLFSVRTPL